MSCEDPESVSLGGETISSKEFRSEFYAPDARIDDGVSLDRRPDAISFDYLTAFSLGPVQLGDFSAGPVDRAWKVRCSGTSVFASRENDARDGFEDETLVFSFTGIGAIEIDAAFDQSAHILVCMERATGVDGSSEIWIYYYDPFLAGYTLANFGRGRTPRAVLDDILDSSNADILVFYLADTVGLCWRQQRERYLVERVVNQTAATIPDTSLMVMQGPVTWSYDYPPQVGVPGESGFAGYPEHATDPITYTGPSMDAFTPYPLNTGIRIGTGAGTLRIIEESGGKPIGYPGVGFSGIVEDTFNQDYGTWVSRRDYGALIRFSSRVYYAEVQAYMMKYPGSKIQAMNDDFSVVAEFVYDASPDAVTRQLGVVYHQDGFTMLLMQGTATDSTHWSNVRFSESQLPGPLVPTTFDFPNTYLEDVYKATSGRIVIIYSVRNPVTGRYSLGTIATVLYPYVMDVEGWLPKSATPVLGTLQDVIKYIMSPGELNPAGNPPNAYIDVESWKVITPYPLSGILHDIVITHSLYDVDEWKVMTPAPLSGILFQIIIAHTLYDVDEWKINTPAPISGILFLAIIVHDLYDVDNWKVNVATPVSGTLV